MTTPPKDPTQAFDSAFATIVNSISIKSTEPQDDPADRAEAALYENEGSLVDVALAMRNYRDAFEQQIQDVWNASFSWVDIALAYLHFVISTLGGPTHREKVPSTVAAAIRRRRLTSNECRPRSIGPDAIRVS